MFMFDFSFNQLDLPVYETYDKLRIYLLKAIHECSEGFGFAWRKDKLEVIWRLNICSGLSYSLFNSCVLF